MHGEARGGESDPGVEDGSGGEGLVGTEMQEMSQGFGGEGEQATEGPGEGWIEDEAGLAGAEGRREGPSRVEGAACELGGGLLPAEQMEVEVVAAGAAVQQEGKEGDEGGEGNQQEGQPVSRHEIEGSVLRRVIVRIRWGEGECGARVGSSTRIVSDGEMVPPAITMAMTPARGRPCAGDERGFHEAGTERVHLFTGTAEPGELDDGMRAGVESGADGEGPEVERAGEDVFAEVAGVEGGKGGRFGCERIQELGLEEMHLGEVRRGGVAADEIAMTHGGAAVGVTIDTEAGEQVNGGLGSLEKVCFGVKADGENDAG